MDRALPEYNTILHQKWIAENRRTHKKKIRDTRCVVDNKLPLALKYPHIKSKKELIIEERCTQIEKSNRLLLEKMTNILAGPATHHQQFSATKYLQKNSNSAV